VPDPDPAAPAPPTPNPATSTSVDRDALVRWLDTYLDAHAGKDFGPNGLQVQGRGQIRKVVTGVSACLELFQKAQERGADAVMVHHGIFWDWQSPRLVGMHYERVAELLAHGVNLLAYHLPLDRHPEVGNNALACRALGLEELQRFGEYAGLPIGFRGRFQEPISSTELLERCRDFYGREPLHFAGGPEPVETVGVISGGAQRELMGAIEAGLDAFVTGEVSEWVMNTARESGTHFLSCGHYATEVCGIRALGELVAERFGVDVEFVDVPNPV
jgi:dinuclear metal center YbgI/SA1388 family protein